MPSRSRRINSAFQFLWLRPIKTKIFTRRRHEGVNIFYCKTKNITQNFPEIQWNSLTGNQKIDFFYLIGTEVALLWAEHRSMAKDGFKRFSPSVSRPKPVHSIYRFHFHTGNFFQATKKFISPWTLVFVFFLSFSPAHGTQSHIQGSHEQFDTLYVKGKNLFYN